MDNRDGYGPVNVDDGATLQGEPRRSSMATERDGMFDTPALKEASASVMNAMAAPSGRTSMSTTRTSRAVEHFDGNPNIPPYESIAEDPEYNRGPSSQRLPPAGWIDFMDRWHEWWVGEIAAALGSLACFAVAVWLLADMDGKRLADWGPAISPNALVATLVVVARFLMLFVVAECIGQLRWLYFQPADHAPRPLADLDLFDGAARGPVGCAKLLVRAKADAWVATWAALVVVVALAMDPFAQQMVSFPARVAPLDAAAAVNGTWMPAAQALEADSDVLSAANLRKTIFAALVGVEEQIDFGCPTGNCTWDAFSSLGLCSACEDVSSSVTPTCSNSSSTEYSSELSGEAIANATCPQLTYTLAGYHNLSLVLQNGSLVERPHHTGASAGNALHGQDPLGTLYSLVRSVAGEAYPAGVRDPRLFEFAVARLRVAEEASGEAWDASTLASPKWNVTACAVSWCAKVYEGVEVRNGKLLNAEPRDVELTASPSSDCWTSSSPTCQEFQPTNSSALPSSGTNTTTFSLALTNTTLSPLLATDHNITLAHNRTDPAATAEAAQIATARAATTLATLLWTHPSFPSSSSSSLATALTTSLRLLSSPSTPTRISGTPLAPQPFIATNWPWLALPAFVVASGAVILVVAIALTCAKGKGERVVWKASNVPLLLLAPPKGEWREDVGPGPLERNISPQYAEPTELAPAAVARIDKAAKIEGPLMASTIRPDTVFRLRCIPKKYGREDIPDLVRKALRQGGDFSVEIGSLARSPYRNDELIATVTLPGARNVLLQLPTLVENENEWQLDVDIGEDEPFSLRLDVHFYGFTPLHGIQEAEHTSE
ncbi:hypothetical protein SLS58_008501 [Diplodia intermedia]|uniref:Uncharacterized protein n=1 Tax=Diplodia intermedia TaxID=856260 RepID=A0ABR3THC7_9PEZI